MHLIEHLPEIVDMGVSQLRLDFTMETPEQMQEILKVYTKRAMYGEKTADCVGDYTKGHFKRGIE